MTKDSLALDTVRDKQRRLDQFAAPVLSGVAFASGLYPLVHGDISGIFAMSCALGYWSRMAYLFWLEAKSW